MLDWSGLAAIDPRQLGPLERHLATHVHEPQADLQAAGRTLSASVRQRGGPAGIAVLSVSGVIAQRASWAMAVLGGTPLDALAAELQACREDSDIGGVLLLVDSPGGGVHGVDEAAAQIAAVATRKPVHAHVSGLCASAAYWLASAATRITAAPSSEVGSIGVYSLHMDHSAELKKLGITPTLVKAGPHKAEGHPFAPLSDADRAAMQERIDAYYGMFVRRVAKGRRTQADHVRKHYGEGRVLVASAARAAGMIDAVGTLEEAFGALRTAMPRGAVTRSDAQLRAELDTLADDVAYRVKHYESDEQRRLRVEIAKVS